MLSPVAARLAVLGAAVLFSVGGMAIKATELSGWQVASLRSAVAAVALLLFVPATRPPWSKRTALVGVAQGATLVLFVLANKLTTAANTIFLQSTAPLYVLVLGPVLLRERPRRGDLGLVAVIAAGMLLFVVDPNVPSATASNPVLGNILAAASGLTWALTIMGLRHIGATGTSSTAAAQAVFLGNVAAALCALPFAVPFGAVGTADIAVITGLGVFQIALAYTLLSAGVQRVRALEVSVLLLVEPALNPVWAWLVHGEVPGAWALTAGGIIVAATLARTWLDTRAAERAI